MNAASDALQAEFAAALRVPGHQVAYGMRAWNGSDPAVRLAIHRNTVMSSLVDALADTFPVVQELVGEPFFRAMAALHVRQSPPSSPVLAHYGRDFPAFVANFEPAACLPYLADVARLEMARVDACHAAEAAPVAADALGLALASGERVRDLRLGCRPGLSVIHSPHAVVSLWAAHQDGSDLGAIDPDPPEDALVLRVGMDVLVLRLPPGGAPFMEALSRGCALGTAADEAVSAAPDFDLGSLLTLLITHGAVTSIDLPEGLPA